ncbi:hypothetical protein HYX12_02870 [Candidatus Woesearchaeota archaeon]|nr:hypothetical protein [Candidatus Woesearchaeota archaeon]
MSSFRKGLSVSLLLLGISSHGQGVYSSCPTLYELTVAHSETIEQAAKRFSQIVGDVVPIEELESQNAESLEYQCHEELLEGKKLHYLYDCPLS